jgi:hypothetical protein
MNFSTPTLAELGTLIETIDRHPLGALVLVVITVCGCWTFKVWADSRK